MLSDDEYRIGLISEDPQRSVRQQLDQALDHVEVLGPEQFPEKTVVPWSACERVGIYVFVDSKFTDTHMRDLAEKLSTSLVKDNAHKIHVFVAYDTPGEKVKALKVFCTIYANQDLGKLHVDVLSKDEVLLTSPSGRDEGLQFVKFYYDVGAVSKDMEPGKYGFVPGDLKDSVLQEGVVPERFWYWDEESAILWHKLASPKSKYALTQKTTELLQSCIEDVLEIIDGNDKDSTSGGIDFVDLGVGTPEKDRIVIEAIVKNTRSDTQLMFYPMDISFPLLEYTLRRVLPLRAECETRRPFEIRMGILPVLGNFESLSNFEYQALLSNEQRRLFALLGNTLGNLIEGDMLDCLAAIMEPGDYFLIDAELVDDVKENKKITDQYNTKERNVWGQTFILWISSSYECLSRSLLLHLTLTQSLPSSRERNNE